MGGAMRIYIENGVTVLECTTEEAGPIRSLLCQASPRGEAQFGPLGVRIVGDAAPAVEPHIAIDELP